ncbi:MAG: LuxR C-terminal-related transcriptional regulator [Bacteroidales bacterium]|jgi:RNA polymerase sigma-70 factor (ECF subfamily)|nr:LuxR C-terminal-related transcriptional regulator [Bacteroidales bacterium]
MCHIFEPFAINDEPAQCRDIFRKSRYEGMSHQDIARDLNISVRTVETHIYRALKILKKALNYFFSSLW